LGGARGKNTPGKQKSEGGKQKIGVSGAVKKKRARLKNGETEIQRKYSRGCNSSEKNKITRGTTVMGAEDEERGGGLCQRVVGA